MANQEHFNTLKKGVTDWNDWREANPTVIPDLTNADLRRRTLQEANLTRANLTGANLRRAELIRADLGEAILYQADLEWADLRWVDAMGANFSEAKLSRADMYKADLAGARMKGATMFGCNLEDANCFRVDFADAKFLQTRILNTNLREGQNLHTVRHEGPSILDFDTLSKNGVELTQKFLRGCGLDEPAIKAAFSGIAQDIAAQLARLSEFYSCYISYSAQDADFATLLHERLQQEGVRCWFDKRELLPGDDIFKCIDKNVRQQGKLLLCASKSVLGSWWVDHEIACAFSDEREIMKARGEKEIKLIALDLDGFLSGQDCPSSVRSQTENRVAAKFQGWKEDRNVFNREFEKLVCALRRKS